MGMRDCDFCFFESELGHIWRFSILEDTLFYELKDNTGTFQKIKWIKDIKLYDIIQDVSKKIHILYLDKYNGIYYQTYKNNKWEEQLVEKHTANFTIDNICILSINQDIHIFYESLNNFARSKSKLKHIHIFNDKWYTNLPLTFNLLKSVKSYFISNFNNGHIILFYLKFSTDRWMQYTKIYSPVTHKWSQKKVTKVNRDSTKLTSFFIDSRNQLHLLYQYTDKIYWEKYAVGMHHSFIKINLCNQSIVLENMELINCLIFEFDTVLWISWEIENEMYYIYSDNYGDSWSSNQEPFTVKLIEKVNNIDIDYENSLNKATVDIDTESTVNSLMVKPMDTMDSLVDNRENKKVSEINQQTVSVPLVIEYQPMVEGDRKSYAQKFKNLIISSIDAFKEFFSR